MAIAAEGTFTDKGGRPSLVQGPPRSVAIMAVLQNAISDARNGKSTDEIVSSLREKSPEFAELAANAVRSGGIVSLIAMLLYLMSICSQHTEGTINWNQLIDQAHSYWTKSDTYPFGDSPNFESPQSEEGEKDQQRRFEGKTGPSRQQKRQLERQAKKLLPKAEPSPPTKTGGLKKPKKT